MGLNKMMDKIADYDDAILFAVLAHGNQCDFRGRPYILHPVRVSESAWELGLSAEAVCAAVLHDVVEDNAQVTTAMIEALAGPRVAHLVDLLTRREGQTYDQFINRLVLSRDYEACSIKICDIQDNLREDRRMNGGDREMERRERYRSALDELYKVEGPGSSIVRSGTVGNRLSVPE